MAEGPDPPVQNRERHPRIMTQDMGILPRNEELAFVQVAALLNDLDI